MDTFYKTFSCLSASIDHIQYMYNWCIMQNVDSTQHYQVYIYGHYKNRQQMDIRR